MKALDCARREMEQITVERRIFRALKSKITPASKYTFRPGSSVRVYREEAKRWIGPVEVFLVEGKMIRVTDGAKVKQFNVVQVMPLQTGDSDMDKDIERIFRQIDDMEAKAKNFDLSVYLTEVLKPGDPRIQCNKSKESVKTELDGLYSQGVFEEVKEKDIPHDAVILPSKMVYAIKNIGKRKRSSLGCLLEGTATA